MGEEVEKFDAKHRQAAILSMKGYTYVRIAEEMGVSPQTASRWVNKYLDSITTQDQVEQLRAEHYARYMEIISLYSPKMGSQESAAYLVMNAMKNIESIFPLKAAQRIDMRYADVTPQDTSSIDAELSKIMEEIRQQEHEALMDPDIVEGEVIDSDPPE